ncbi:Alpha beta-hydrolase [Paramicrosporidium saccamoebae]|uniref:Alpha beta-hydrolase n=1 Tax=Paramicrosporidium saccamoebae TaxID=1246581 RepID=A0A2H9TJX7_9FUNG|nr:Alpha beta-hydrolase [Paramicrosporidium saccamoebae]
MGVNLKRREIYISFRGSYTLINWLYNLYAVMTVIPWRRSCFGLRQPKVHEGFLLAYESVSEEVIMHVTSLLGEHPDFVVHVVGHSLGGALATICAMELNESLSFAKKVKLSSYGAPRVGNDDFARLVEKHFPDPLDRLRVTNGNDIVPHVPPYFLEYHQSAQEIFIPPGSKKTSSAYACDPSSGEDPRCAAAHLGYSVDDHCYFPWGLNFCSPCET